MEQVAKYLNGGTFKLYRASGIPFTDRLPKKHRETIVTELAKYLYQIYKQNLSSYEEDVILRYSSYRDIANEIITISGSVDELRYLVIKSRNSRLLPRQTFVFSKLENNNDTLLFSRVTSKPEVNDYLLKLLQVQIDLILIEYGAFPLHLIPSMINKLSTRFHSDLRLVYETPQLSGLLNSIQIEVPYTDVKELRHRSGSDKLYANISRFMYECTKIKFDKSKIKKFASDVVNLSSNGRINFHGKKEDADNEDEKEETALIMEVIMHIHWVLNEG
ncbi:hypothetical protein KGF57_001734 [Candida theae]|uniref:Uncharacterized protein n=1 Tax=Candida theae TaxID=1198502 RepID=A0AAD5BGF1_9ASCO|nr:uncharacterized protein KGF57_001734 [Candida theae]KAI5961497.1 hypothetical protein KGF57_001734 [Candida theae]